MARRRGVGGGDGWFQIFCGFPFVNGAIDVIWLHIQMGESTLSPPKIVSTNIIFLQIFFPIMYGHHILIYLFFSIYVISFKPNLTNILENSKNIKKLNIWNIFVTKYYPSQSLKIWIYISKLGLWMQFLGEFFMVYDINLHQLNLGKF